MFEFASPYYLLLLILPLLLLWQRQQQRTLPYSQIGLVRPYQRSWRLKTRPFLPWLKALGLTMLVLALAQPRWGERPFLLAPTDTEMVLALDISLSMQAQDLTPLNRLEAAKGMLADLVTVRPYDRIGLVLFAGDAFAQLPPTRDHEAVLQALTAVNLANNVDIPDGTALGLGLATAAGLLAQSPAPNRLVVLLTDGASTDETVAPLTAAAAAAATNIRIHTVGVGQPGLVPFPQPGLGTTSYLPSPLDEPLLQEIATITGGSYTRAADNLSMTQVVTAVATDASTHSQPPQLLRQQQELFPWLLGAGLLCLLLELLLRQHVAMQLPGGQLG